MALFTLRRLHLLQFQSTEEGIRHGFAGVNGCRAQPEGTNNRRNIQGCEIIYRSCRIVKATLCLWMICGSRVYDLACRNVGEMTITTTVLM